VSAANSTRVSLLSPLWPIPGFLIMLRMVVTLEKRQIIKRTPGASRSIQLVRGPDQLPEL
jgi:hypothetical protein